MTPSRTSPIASSVLTLRPALPRADEPTWAGAAWVGAVDRPTALAATTVALAGADGFRRARLLVRDGLEIAGSVDVSVTRTGTWTRAELGRALRALRPRSSRPTPAPHPWGASPS